MGADQSLTTLNLQALNGALSAAVNHQASNTATIVYESLRYLSQRLAPEDPALQNALKDALDGAQELSDHVRLMRDLGRTAPSTRRPFSAEWLVQEARRRLDARLYGRARLSSRVGSCPALRGDPERLLQVVLNLLVNAVRAVELGSGGQVRLDVHCTGEQVWIEVSDEGPGVAPEDRERIFDRFVSCWPEEPGTGLGLYVSRLIAGAHGGALTLEAAPIGARFRLALPVERPTSKGRVLLIDDEVPLTAALGRLLGRTFEVVICHSGNEGIRRLEKDADFQVVLCDLTMADGTGVDVHRWLSAHRPALLPRLVFLTGGAPSGELQRFLSASGARVLEKPFDPMDLRQLVADYTKRFSAVTPPE